MVHVIRSLAVTRRTLLRGAGAALALPWLDAMWPALRPAPAPALRTLFVFAPNGVCVEAWRPRAERLADGLPPTLEPLAGLADRVTVFGGFALDGGRSHGDGPGDHARAAASFLTCAHPRKTGGADIRAGVSIDQLLAASLGARTAFPSLEVGLEAGRSAGNCDSGYSCAYTNNIAWRSPTEPVAKETSPRALFARLFGDPDGLGSAAAQRARRHRLRSVLDVALADFKRLRRGLAPGDQQRLDAYAEAVRSIEQRLQRDEAAAADERIEVSPEVLERRRDEGIAGRMDLVYDLLALAFETDRTRIATLMLGNAGSDRSHRFLGAPESHHELSHHGRNRDKLARIARIDRFQIERLAAFLARLESAREGSGSLLDASLVMYGSGIGDGDRHNHDQLPILLAGRAGGRVRAGRYLEFGRETPLANLYLTIARLAGLGVDSFGDSDGTVDAILA